MPRIEDKLIGYQDSWRAIATSRLVTIAPTRSLVILLGEKDDRSGCGVFVNCLPTSHCQVKAHH
ncbi:MAG: hypothetical protein NZ772_00360 [Cyanobacteria bacterium]|nr:hypothetical protein [Cyanobacteriota bacterium]MDW8199782.1 hypothetical protein [Cyanobacteriota bacterium SKYGB_h_bin112]